MGGRRNGDREVSALPTLLFKVDRRFSCHLFYQYLQCHLAGIVFKQVGIADKSVFIKIEFQFAVAHWQLLRVLQKKRIPDNVSYTQFAADIHLAVNAENPQFIAFDSYEEMFDLKCL